MWLTFKNYKSDQAIVIYIIKSVIKLKARLTSQQTIQHLCRYFGNHFCYWYIFIVLFPKVKHYIIPKLDGQSILWRHFRLVLLLGCKFGELNRDFCIFQIKSRLSPTYDSRSRFFLSKLLFRNERKVGLQGSDFQL